MRVDSCSQIVQINAIAFSVSPKTNRLCADLAQLGYASHFYPFDDKDVAGMIEARAMRAHETYRV